MPAAAAAAVSPLEESLPHQHQLHHHAEEGTMLKSLAEMAEVAAVDHHLVEKGH
jgi:hypothetical protein